jgi:putative molybdopterin biosynthesis protein
VASAVAEGSADVGLGVYSAAHALGLDFIALGPEEYDFAVPRRFLELPALQAFLEVLNSRLFRERLEELGGYGFARTGELIFIE